MASLNTGNHTDEISRGITSTAFQTTCNPLGAEKLKLSRLESFLLEKLSVKKLKPILSIQQLDNIIGYKKSFKIQMEVLISIGKSVKKNKIPKNL